MPRFGCIFDMDGVLIDSGEAHYQSWQRMLHRHGLEMTPEQFADTFGQTNRAIIRKLWPDRATDENIRDWGEEKEQDFRDVLREHFPEMPHASALLGALHAAGFALAVGSSGPRENVDTVLAGLGAGTLFDATVTGCDVTHSKPHPEVFLKAAQKLGLPPARCAVVEDAPVGVRAARAAGMAAIALTGTAGADELATEAHCVVDSLDQLTPDRVAELIEAHATGRSEPSA